LYGKGIVRSRGGTLVVLFILIGFQLEKCVMNSDPTWLGQKTDQALSTMPHKGENTIKRNLFILSFIFICIYLNLNSHYQINSINQTNQYHSTIL